MVNINIKLLWHAFGKFMDLMYGTDLYDDEEYNNNNNNKYLPVFDRCDGII
jgi:hypothetical protein